MPQLALAAPPVLWKAHPGPQTHFLATRAHEVLFGGQAGGGKSAAIVAAPLRWIHHPDFLAVILRRDTTQLGNLLEKAEALYPKVVPGARVRHEGSSAIWRFPSGARVWFTHCQHDKDISRFDGEEIQFLGLDELTHFTEKQYTLLRARIRSPHKSLPMFSRATANPGGPGHNWVFRRFAPWLWREPGTPELPTWDGPRALPGEVLWYVPEDGGERWVEKGTPGALSRVFIPSSLADNPSLAGSGYREQLMDLDAVRRAQLLNGDWLVRPAAGNYFKRAWFQLVDEAPRDVIVRLRYWDRAATKPHENNRDPDWTRGLRMSLDKDGIWYVEHVASERDQPHIVKRLVKQTAELDGKRCVVGIEQDPGQAGVAEAHDQVRNLVGWNVRLFRPTGDKVTRAQAVSAQAGAGNVRLVRGQWNAAFLDELESFPDGGHDDQVDALSGAFSAILMLKQPVPTAQIRSPLSELG